MRDRDTHRYGAAARIPGLDPIAVVPSPGAEPAPGGTPEALFPGFGPDDSVTAPDAPDEGTGSGLTERDLDILDFERQWWKHAGAKERAVRDRFGCSPTRYYQALNALLDRPEALEHDPMLVQRLRRLRAARQQARSAVRRPGA
ncbi:DUF3263 domain-containing protein [Yinghuangia soli]|uniref:DUF3263 domain-containing protein n=1 Tax=Yinghuangia soli TaxID=2908204 RepID=A0AA41Q0T1_9ACTN|nr:DUF3263 domain-containing protein [Yinghuangia soli]MCF2529398.1 DUF3263 domain-containing protein [Yinghuangia soli]